MNDTTHIAFGRFERGEKVTGRYHAPAGEPRGTAIVLCSPGGVEDVWCYATYRVLAERLAAQGFPVIRFDYHGMGDSSGWDRDPGRVRAWLDSTLRAVEEVKTRSGAEQVGLFGVRLGATLATLAAIELGGVESLALWAPVAGRAFVREFKAYALLNKLAPPPPGFPVYEGDAEAAGFVLTAETVAALTPLDLTKMPIETRPASRILLLARDESANEDKLAARFESLGAAVTQKNPSGYADMMAEPRKAIIPEAALDAIVAWLAEGSPRRSRAAERPTNGAGAAQLASASPYTKGAVVEEPITFGPGGRFFGVLTEPANEGSARAKTALISLTIASHYRIGANRLHVAFSREAAARGFSALRFDISGIGDSRTENGAPPAHPYAIESREDVKHAVDALYARGVRRFVVTGLCSGAFLAYHSALYDTRVNGAVLLNPQIFYFKEGDSLDIGRKMTFKSTNTYKDLLFKPESWRRLVKGEINVRVIANIFAERAKRFVETRAGSLLDAARGKKRESVKADLQAICGRGARVLCIYSAADEGIDYLELHIGKGTTSMKKYPSFEIQIIDGPDHTFAPIWSQQRVTEMIMAHLERHFG